MAIPFVDLKRQSETIENDLLRAIAEVSRSGHYILGPQLSAFEKEVAEYLKIPHAAGVASGTDALFLALVALGVGSGDEVITTPFSFIAAVEMVLALGAVPVFADIDPTTFNLDPEKIELQITPKTKAVLVVHLFGHSAEMNSIGEICRKRDLFLIEDVCQAFGGSYGKKKTGTMGDVGCFSFYPTKNLGGMGDGGLVVTSQPEIDSQIRILRNHGSRNGEEPQFQGWNSRLDEMQAAILRVKLKHLDRWNQQRKELAAYYHQNLSKVPVECPTHLPQVNPTYQNYTIRSPSRDRIRESLSAQDIGSMIYYPKPLYKIPAVEKSLSAPLPHLLEVERACREVLSLPLYPGLSKKEVEKVCETIGKATK